MLPINLDPLSIFTELFVSMLLISKFLNIKAAFSAKKYVYMLLATLLVAVNQIFIQVPVIVIITAQLIFFLVIMLYYKLPLQKSVLCYLFSNVITIIIGLPVIIFFKRLEQLSFLPIIISIYLVILGFLISYFLPLDKGFNYICNQKLVVSLLLINCSIILLFVLFYFQLKSTSSNENSILLACVGIIVAAVNSLQYTTYIKSKEKDNRLALLEEYMPILDEMIIAVRERQHNYNNQLQAIRSLPYTHKSYEELSTALLGPDTKNLFENTPIYLLKTNLTIVAGYLYKKSLDAKKCNKELIIVLEDTNLPTKISQYELIEILGILIDNALEATPAKTYVKVIISRNDETIIIKTYNQGPIVDSGLIRNMLTPGYTTKTLVNKAEHGLGLPRLKEYLDTTGGSLLIKNETIDETRNIVFIVEI